MNKYNTIIRQRISDKYVSASKWKQELIHERNGINLKMDDPAISHAEYLRLQRDLEVVENMMRSADVEIATWDKAREICLEVSDELFDKM